MLNLLITSSCFRIIVNQDLNLIHLHIQRPSLEAPLSQNLRQLPSLWNHRLKVLLQLAFEALRHTATIENHLGILVGELSLAINKGIHENTLGHQPLCIKVHNRALRQTNLIGS